MPLVVIVDDQAINLRVLSRFAEAVEPGVDVRTFSSPVAALRFVTENVPDLIVTDFVMPDMTGDDFIARCRAVEPLTDVPIIVVTAFEDCEYRYRALDVGATDYLLSPVDPREFCIRARNLLALWRHQRALRARTESLESELATTLVQYAEEVRVREEQLRRVVNAVPALIRATDAEGHVVFLNKCHEEVFGVRCEEMPGRNKAEIFAEDYARRHLEFDEQVIAAGKNLAGIEEDLVDRNGTERVFLTTKSLMRGNPGGSPQIVTVSLDITQRKAVEQAVRESEERFRSLVEGSVLGILIEASGVALFANQACARLLGFETAEELMALPTLEDLLPGDALARVPVDATDPVSGPREIRCHKRNGAPIWVEMQAQDVSWHGQEARQFTLVDVTLRRAYAERLHRQANYDQVTGLPNRALALDRLQTAVASALRHGHKGSLIFIDLDHFKKINDTWGHSVGDQLLRMAAERLQNCVRSEDTVARLGGDEFTVILPNLPAGSHAEPVLYKILAAFSQPFVLGRNEAFVSASIGVSIFPDDSDDPAILMRHADAAMYQAKDQGRNTFRFFTPEMNARALERMRIEGHLMHALERGEFSLHYQPIIEARTGELTGAEALLRWTNPSLGNVEPDRFISLAEDTGLIVAIGRWGLETACRQLRAWRARGLPRLRMSVNVSSRQLRSHDFVDDVCAALRRHDLPSSALELEITEGCLMTEGSGVGDVLKALDSLGVRLALDDFGTGYSCLSYLKDLPVDTVKIDRSFIADVSHDANDATVVEAIIAMAHRMSVGVVAEGVATFEQLEFVRSRGCDFAQGFFISQPLPSAAFEEWCAARAEGRKLAL